MIINRNIWPYYVLSEDEIGHALKKISENKTGVVFCLSESGVLEGVLTDGDIRRWLLSDRDFSLTRPVSEAMNRSYCFFPEREDPARIEQQFSARIRYVPLVDGSGRLSAIAFPRTSEFSIAGHVISDDTATFIVAEIGNNHNGSLDAAKRLIDAAAAAGADCAKFQLRDLETLYRQAHADDLGTEYTIDLLRRFQLSPEDLFRAFDHCRQADVIPLCTPWDEKSLERLENYGLPAYKIASADLTNLPFIEKICATGKPLIVSTGMSSEEEIVNAVRRMTDIGAEFALLHCNSTYPAPFKDINLRYLARLKKIGGGCPIGYSGHERGHAVPVAAVALGARIVEKHLTSDRALEGNDHKVSLLPDEFAEMTRAIRSVEESLGTSQPRKLSQGELFNRETLAKSVVARGAIASGTLLTADHFAVKSPGRGLPPYLIPQLIGKAAKHNFQADDFFYYSDLGNETAEPREYRFQRPFGIPVRYHDLDSLAGRSNFSVLEFHLSYRDLDIEVDELFLNRVFPQQLIVHAPELFAGDHILDLSTHDNPYRDQSIRELKGVVDKTLQLNKYFNPARAPLIIVNVGGWSLDSFLPTEKKCSLYQRVGDALDLFRNSGVQLIPQTMPPFPWHFGGQRYHNLFMDPDEIVTFCRERQYKVCLDVSHSKLACNFMKASFDRFVRAVAPYTEHLHLVDARGTDGEGLQIGEGEIDFAALARTLDDVNPGASFIPEIWQGHKNDGEGFWIALDRLEKAFIQPRA